MNYLKKKVLSKENDLSKEKDLKYTNFFILTGATGNVGKQIIQLLSSKTDNFIIYTTSSNCDNKFIELNNTLCIEINLIDNIDIEKLVLFMKNIIRYILKIKKDSKIFFINAAADKDTNKLKSTIKENQKDIIKNGVIDIYKYWTITSTEKLAITCRDLNIPFIHISTVYVNEGIPTSDDGWDNNTVDIKEKLKKFLDILKVSSTDMYLYGYTKALIEQKITDVYTSSNSVYYILRLPVIVDQHIKQLSETSPSSVINEIITYMNNSETKSKSLNDSQKRYPVSAKYVAECVSELIYTSHPKPKIISLIGKIS